MQRENQTLIALRLDPDLLAALDTKRAAKRQSRSEFIREAIYKEVSDLVSHEVVYPQDRVGKSKGGRPKKTSLTPVSGSGKKSTKLA